MKLLVVIFSLFLTSAIADDNILTPEAKQLLTAQQSDIIMGSKDAPVTMIEYSSLSCPHCSYFHQNIFNDFKTKYIDTNKVKYIHRDFPLDQVALKGSELAHCAEGDKYYVFLKVLFEKQASWAPHKNYLELLENIGKLGGISGEKFQSCMNDKSMEDKILEVRLKATEILKVNATPTFYINGEKLAFVKDLESMSKEIDKFIPKS